LMNFSTVAFDDMPSTKQHASLPFRL
jgi:hypothetical protein